MKKAIILFLIAITGLLVCVGYAQTAPPDKIEKLYLISQVGVYSIIGGAIITLATVIGVASYRFIKNTKTDENN